MAVELGAGVPEAVALGDVVGLNAGLGVIVDVDVAVAVAVGALMVRFICWVVLTVSAEPVALMKARFENVIFDVPTTKPLSERVSTWTVPVWPLALLVVRLIRKFPLPWSVHVPVRMALLRLQLRIVISDVA